MAPTVTVKAKLIRKLIFDCCSNFYTLLLIFFSNNDRRDKDISSCTTGREMSKQELFEKLKADSLSYLQLFRVLVAYVFIQGKKLNNVNRFPDTSKINFLKYCYKKMSVVDDISDIELKECCEALKLL